MPGEAQNVRDNTDCKRCFGAHRAYHWKPSENQYLVNEPRYQNTHSRQIKSRVNINERTRVEQELLCPPTRLESGVMGAGPLYWTQYHIARHIPRLHHRASRQDQHTCRIPTGRATDILRLNSVTIQSSSGGDEKERNTLVRTPQRERA